MKTIAVCLLSCASFGDAFLAPGKKPPVRHRVWAKRPKDDYETTPFDPLGFARKSGLGENPNLFKVAAPGALAAALAGTPAPAEAASQGDAIPSAFAAYGHYLGLILVAASLTAERLTIKPGMTDDEEERLATADIVYGIAGVLVLFTGYLRVTQFGKGWDFYSHSPVFWVKMVLFTVMGSASFFPTIKIIQRAVGKKNGEDVPPMSEKLAARMTSIINAELLAIASIPLAAALMARGVGYAEWLPWPVGAAPVGLAAVGLGVKYVKEALDWEEA